MPRTPRSATKHHTGGLIFGGATRSSAVGQGSLAQPILRPPPAPAGTAAVGGSGGIAATAGAAEGGPAAVAGPARPSPIAVAARQLAIPTRRVLRAPREAVGICELLRRL